MAGIPVSRVIEKLDEYLNLNDDYKAAERHLKYWLSEAEELGDRNGEFAIVNEMIGMYRKCGRRDEAFAACDRVLELTDIMELSENVGGATAFLNVATANKAFGNPEKAVELYTRARKIYERDLKNDDSRMAGLYNNLALALEDTGRYDEAKQLYLKAIDIMKTRPGGEADCAISYLNMAEMVEIQSGFEAGEDEILSYMDEAWKLLNSDELPRNGYYAFVADKCVPLFRHYEYFLVANELERRIADIRGNR